MRTPLDDDDDDDVGGSIICFPSKQMRLFPQMEEEHSGILHVWQPDENTLRTQTLNGSSGTILRHFGSLIFLCTGSLLA